MCLGERAEPGGGTGEACTGVHLTNLAPSRWRARQLVKNIPPSDMAQIKAKVAAMAALQELRQDWGCRRAWARDYLSSVSAWAVGAGCQGGARDRDLPLCP